MNIDLEKLVAMMQALKEFEISELEIAQGEDHILMKRGPSGVQVVTAPSAMTVAPMAPPAFQQHAAPESAAPIVEEEEGTWVTSPFVGTFYRAPSPEAKAFVKEGDEVRVGQALCIVEAMKLMNEIEAEISGTVVRIVAENGKPVEYGDRLFLIK